MLRKYYYRSFLRDELPVTKHSNRDVVELTLVRDIQLTHQLHRARIFSVMRCLCGLQQSGWAHKDTSVDTLDKLLRYRLVELGNGFTKHLSLMDTLWHRRLLLEPVNLHIVKMSKDLVNKQEFKL